MARKPQARTTETRCTTIGCKRAAAERITHDWRNDGDFMTGDVCTPLRRQLRTAAGADQLQPPAPAGRTVTEGAPVTRARRAAVAAGALTVAVAVAGCGQGQFWGPPAPPPARAKVMAGPAYHAEVAYLAAHPARLPAGMQAGILVRSVSPGWASQNLNGGGWTGAVVIPGGWLEQLSSDSGDDGMAQLASVGDEIEFPAPDVPADAPSDDGNDTPAKVLVYGAVQVP